jgi:hypothetical protein
VRAAGAGRERANRRLGPQRRARHRPVARRRPLPAQPYALHRLDCSDEGLNISLEASEAPRLSTLDRIALFLDRHKDLNLDTNLHSSAKLKFTVGLANIYTQEAHARIMLRIRF